MQVNLNQIVASEKPIRTTWSEEEMIQLVDSIKQWGVIQAVKLRPLPGVEPCPVHEYDYHNDGDICERCFYALREVQEKDVDEPLLFEIVDGTRRVNAARLTGLEYINADIEQMNDQTALVQSFVANRKRDDMNDVDCGHAVQRLRDDLLETNGVEPTINGLANMLNESRRYITTVLLLAQEPQEIQEMVSPMVTSNHAPITAYHVDSVRRAQLPTDDKIDVLRKAQKEHMNRQDALKVAESIKAAGDNEDAKQALLEKPYSAKYHNPERVRHHLQGAKDDGRKSMSYTTSPPELPQVVDEWELLDEAADVMDFMNEGINRVPNFVKVAEIGKLSSEGQRFLSRRMGMLIVALSNFQTKIDNGEYDNG